MASEESSDQKEQVPATLPIMASDESSNQNEKAPSKSPSVANPTESIAAILKVVEELHAKLVAQSQKNNTISIPRSTSSIVPGGETGGKPRMLKTATSVPIQLESELEKKKFEDDSERYIPKLQRNLRLLKEDVEKLQDLRTEVVTEVGKHKSPLDKLLDKLKDASTTQLTKGMKKDLEDINKKIFNLMCQVPLLPNKRKKPGELGSDEGTEVNNGKGIVCLHGIHGKGDYLKSLAVYRDVKEKFKALTSVEKICLLSFAVFPENQEVNRTMLMYWWIGEGILAENPEDEVKEILGIFMERKLIQAVENKRKVEPNSYKMSPFVHSSVVLISEEIGLFNIYIDKKRPTMNLSKLNKVCLMEDSSNLLAKDKKMKKPGLIETVFNVSERFPDFAFKWFSEDAQTENKKYGGSKKLGPLSNPVYKALKVFYLGRWERTAKRHIEVENPELMKNLKYMKKLRLLSFQGISRIERLENAVCKLQELIILDLRACYNLEKLPDKIDSLKALIYLDITDCYMIDRMPKRLSWLDNLEVLKGFVVSDATDEETVCTLAELVHLKKLRKLSITINKGDFGVNQLIEAIKDFKMLEKLKVAWGGINTHTGTDKQKAVNKPPTSGDNKNDVGINNKQTKGINKPSGGRVGMLERAVTFFRGDAAPQGPPKLPKNLKKLDLQCFPDRILPTWLQPKNLKHLEKLYIKGGTELTGFGESEPEYPTECNVKILRLKFLPRLKVEWRELKELFPKLEFLDKYQSPQVSFCPCDGLGIWRGKPQVKAILN